MDDDGLEKLPDPGFLNMHELFKIFLIEKIFLCQNHYVVFAIDIRDNVNEIFLFATRFLNNYARLIFHFLYLKNQSVCR